MSIFTCVKKCLTLSVSVLLLSTANLALATDLKNSIITSPHVRPLKKEMAFTPAPIPVVNTPEMKNYVNKFHTFPSPFGYEPYRDEHGNPLNFAINVINKREPYLPVTFYCNSDTNCPTALLLDLNGLYFFYNSELNGKKYVIFQIKGMPQDQMLNGMSFYLPNDPKLYTAKNITRPPYLYFDKNARKGDPLVTILFSQRILQSLSEYKDGKLKGYFSVNNRDIALPLANGKESISVGTTLSLIGLGEDSGMEFTESVSQTTGESYTSQVQSGFSVNASIEDTIIIGGGESPVSNWFKVGINTTLSSMVSNSITIANEKTVTRTYTIKPGINSTYYWAIYQLLYSYRINAPLLERVLQRAQSLFGNTISFKIGNNSVTQDGKLVGNLLPPQAPYLANDITVGVAVPVTNNNLNEQIFSQRITSQP